ncbi:MAG: hypothetical protein HY543_03535 [Deltaproteobacteria bacterium]|nr:hypothetical protein [Deltaproteobacteria bacterium]
MAKLVDVIQRASCFQPGSALCMGCMESIAFQNVGKLTDNDRKTIFAFGTFCGEVSTLQFPDIVAWGRGDTTPAEWTKSFGIIHHVFESAPTVAEGIRDTADLLAEVGALSGPVQVAAVSGDGGAVAIGLRSFLHTINRGARVTLMVLVNEIFANTGFQYSPVTPLGAETSTTPIAETLEGNCAPPMDYLALTIAAGAGLVAQVSPAFPKLFVQVVETALQCPTTAVLFVPSPCITGWKYAEGETVRLARLGCETGFFPCFVKERGKPGVVKFVEPRPEDRPPIEEFMGPQRRFHHLVEPDPATGRYRARPGKEAAMDRIRAAVAERLAALRALAALP